MPFGLTNSHSTYQRSIDTALRSATNSLPYVDYRSVHSATMTAHLQDLRSTLECYRRASMQLRRDKCRIGYSEIEFVGNVITAEGHRPLPRLIEKIKIQEKAFLGLVNYYREFLPKVAQVASPLYNPTLGDCEWLWNSECEESFCSMRDALSTNAIALAYPQWDRTFFVEVDASKVAVGVC